MREKYLVAVCDILGFARLVEDLPLDSVVDDAMGWFRKALHHSIVGGEFAKSPPRTRELENHPNLAVAWFSDTVLLYTRRDTDDAVGQLLQALAALLFETILGGVTKVRAGVAYGEAHMDPQNSIYIGLPIVDAHSIEKNQQWAGAALTLSACERVNACGPAGDLARWWVTRWNVPLKGGATIDTLAVNWSQNTHDPSWRLTWSKSSALPTEGADPSLVEKFFNTKIFHEAHCEDCKCPDRP